MKVLLFNGSPHKDGTTNFALNIIKEELIKNDIDAEIIWLDNKPINDCVGCGYCHKNKRCVFNDGINEIVEKCRLADGFVFGTPTYYSHPTGRILSYLDRMFYSGKDAFMFKPAASISVARRAGNIMSYDVLNKYAGISSMPIITANYWNMMFGLNKEDAKYDEEGIDTMKNIAKNLAWILKCIDLGKKNGIEVPENKHSSTNFIKQK